MSKNADRFEKKEKYTEKGEEKRKEKRESRRREIRLKNKREDKNFWQTLLSLFGLYGDR